MIINDLRERAQRSEQAAGGDDREPFFDQARFGRRRQNSLGYRIDDRRDQPRRVRVIGLQAGLSGGRAARKAFDRMCSMTAVFASA